MPTRQPCHPDRHALFPLADKPVVLSVVSSCRRFPDQESPPTALVPPGLSAPKRKAHSQSRLRPHKLRVIRLSLRSSRVPAARCLRRSRRRDRGPVTPPRSGCPVRRSQHPAAFAQSLLPPLPAAFCARVQRLCRGPRPQNAVPYSSINLTIPINQDPSPPDCLILRSTSDQSKRCALTRTLVSCHPWSLSPLKGRARCLFLRRAARARRAPAKGRMGRSPYPLCRARSLPPPQPIAEHVGPLPPGVPNPNRVPRRQAFEGPRWPRCCHRTRGLRRLAHAGVVPLTLQATRSELRGSTFPYSAAAGT